MQTIPQAIVGPVLQAVISAVEVSCGLADLPAQQKAEHASVTAPADQATSWALGAAVVVSVASSISAAVLRASPS